eukprot:1864486-Rhodomonas_salina.2
MAGSSQYGTIRAKESVTSHSSQFPSTAGCIVATTAMPESSTTRHSPTHRPTKMTGAGPGRSGRVPDTTVQQYRRVGCYAGSVPGAASQDAVPVPGIA